MGPYSTSRSSCGRSITCIEYKYLVHFIVGIPVIILPIDVVCIVGQVDYLRDEVTDVFHALDLAGLPPTDQNELAVEDVLSDLGYYTLAATAFKATQANRTAFGS